MITTKDGQTYVDGTGRGITFDLALIIATVRDSIVKDFNLSIEEANKVVETAYNIGIMSNEERGKLLGELGSEVE